MPQSTGAAVRECSELARLGHSDAIRACVSPEMVQCTSTVLLGKTQHAQDRIYDMPHTVALKLWNAKNEYEKMYMNLVTNTRLQYAHMH